MLLLILAIIKNHSTSISPSLIACLYAFSSWTFFYIYFPQWIDEAIYLPLLAASLLRLLEDGKCKLLYTIMLFLVCITNMQTAYGFIIYIILFSGSFIILCKEKESRNKSIIRLGFYSVIGLMMGSLVLLPSYFQYSNSIRGVGEYSSNMITDIIESNSIGTENWKWKILIASSSILVMFANAMIIFVKRKKLTKRIIFFLSNAIIMFIPVVIESAHLIWQKGLYNGFPMRAFELLSFSTLALSVELISEFNLEDFQPFARTVLRTCSISLYIVLPLFFVAESLKFTEVFEYSTMQNKFYDAQEIRDYNLIYNNPLEKAKNSDGYIQENYQFISGTPASTGYLSILSADTINSTQALGYSNYGVRMADTGGTFVSDAILGYVYNISRTEQDNNLYNQLGNSNHLFFYENKYKLPIGLFLSEGKEYDQFSANNLKFDNQNILCKSLLGTELFSVTYLTEENNYSGNIDVYKDDLLYVYVKSEFQKEVGIMVDGSYIDLPLNQCCDEQDLDSKRLQSYGTTALINSYNESKSVSISVTGPVDGIVEIGKINLNNYMSAIDSLESCINHMSYDMNGISFTVTNDSNLERELFIPLSSALGGMQCRINGKSSTIGKVFGDFIKIDVMPGESSVEIFYSPLYEKIAMLIFLLAATILILDYRFSFADQISRVNIIAKTVGCCFYFVYSIFIIANLVCIFMFMIGGCVFYEDIRLF